MLKSIYIVTLLVLNVSGSEQAYQEELGYETLHKGTVSAEWASLWDAPAVEGQDFALMAPESGAEVYLRFIQAVDQGNYEPMKTLGWNAVELQALDPDSLVSALNPDRFEIIGPPAFLTDKNNIRAAQVLGPDRELLYLTHVIDPDAASFNIGTAQTRVDRVFIMVLGTADLAGTTTFYQDWLGQPISGPWPYRVSVLSEAWGRDPETLYDLSIAQLEDAFLIEIDGYPAAAPRRSRPVNGLPFGPAIVSFRVHDLKAIERRSGRTAVALAAAPYDGAHVLTLEGPSGELIELVGPASKD